MNWKAIRVALLFLLILLNAGLLGYNILQSVERYVVPAERVDGLRERFREKGYALPDDIPRAQYPKKRLRLSANNLESRADSFWDADYEKSYMIGSKILYTCGNETLTVDRDTSSMVYSQTLRPPYAKATEAERNTAERFAARMMQNDELTLLSKTPAADGSSVYTFSEAYQDTLVFSNTVKVAMQYGKIRQAEMTQYAVTGYEPEKQYIYPVDEILSYCLRDMEEPEEKTEKLTLFYGYSRSAWEAGGGFADPCILILYEDGSGLMADQYTVSVSEYQ